ncbi:unnamed protein product [Paramecium sonneborni]|uniref:Uncharacterized protein n=1 Tax=Paramecium sonneborni TaxID=65129 RepID=A0A8S1QZL8_9CILI|nr:unnamed protein product [Paramecium sonneborni]
MSLKNFVVDRDTAALKFIKFSIRTIFIIFQSCDPLRFES